MVGLPLAWLGRVLSSPGIEHWGVTDPSGRDPGRAKAGRAIDGASEFD
jgi:hypothetical protein